MLLIVGAGRSRVHPTYEQKGLTRTPEPKNSSEILVPMLGCRVGVLLAETPPLHRPGQQSGRLVSENRFAGAVAICGVVAAFGDPNGSDSVDICLEDAVLIVAELIDRRGGDSEGSGQQCGELSSGHWIVGTGGGWAAATQYARFGKPVQRRFCPMVGVIGEVVDGGGRRVQDPVKERGSLGPAQVAIGAVQLCVTAEDVFVLEHPLDVALMLVAVVVPETIGAPHTTVGAYRKIVDAQSEVSIIGNDRTAEIHIEPERADIERFLGRPSEAKAVLSEGEIVVHPTLEDTIGATGRVESDMTLHAVPLVLIEDTIAIPQHELTAGTWLIEVIGVVPELDLVRFEVTESGRLEQHTGRPPRVRFRRRVAAAGSEVGHSGETGQLATGDWLEIIKSDPIAEPGLINIIGQLP